MCKDSQIYYANSLNDIFYQMNSIPGIRLVSGCTQKKHIPPVSLCVRNIEELNFSRKYERFFEFGPEITLSSILKIDPAKLPHVFYEAVKSIANTNIRNIATLAGNICADDFYHTLVAPLVALDAKLEIQSRDKTEYIQMAKFNGIPKDFVLTKVIVPTDDWEVAFFKKLGPLHSIDRNSASFVFLANTVKGQLSNLKIAFAGSFCLRSFDLENSLVGSYLPLTRTSIEDFLKLAEETYDSESAKTKVPPILKDQFLNLLKYSIEQLT
ncbi:FAD binding domain-containing protein [Treponema pectinovorum]|uniref:FAD binding domain-containing protein n=1 Tax=Treponema pectinovorum TaxID=164 RepID=UPI003D8C433C